MKQFLKKDLQPFILVLIGVLPFIFLPKAQTLLVINGWHNPIRDAFFKQITWLGEGFMISCCLFLLLFIRVRWFFIFLVALILHLLFINVNKHFFFDDVMRPLGYFKALHKANLLHVVEGIRLHSHHSFPSGHTTGATFAAFFIALVFNRKWISISMAVLGLLVGLSRVYLAQHFLVDIYFGFFFGIVSCLIAVFAIEKIEHKHLWMRYFLIKNTAFRIHGIFVKEVSTSNQ